MILSPQYLVLELDHGPGNIVYPTKFLKISQLFLLNLLTSIKGTKVIFHCNIYIYHLPFLYTSLTHQKFPLDWHFNHHTETKYLTTTIPICQLPGQMPFLLFFLCLLFHANFKVMATSKHISEVAESKGSEKAQTQNHSPLINTQGQIRREKQHSNFE